MNRTMIKWMNELIDHSMTEWTYTMPEWIDQSLTAWMNKINE